MYPVSIGYEGAIQRINDLLRNNHDAEALVTTAFTIEKTLRRTLRQMVVSAGFKSTIAEKIMKEIRGLHAVKNAWEIYDPDHRALISIVGDDNWRSFQEAATMRNKLVHGERVYKLADCRRQATNAR